jgi:hypothetical protein
VTVHKSKNLGEPASGARLTFYDNCADVRSYYAIYQRLKSDKSQRRHLHVFDKAMFVLVCALWEAYCEDVVAETLARLASDALSPHNIPKRVRKQIADHLKAESSNDAIWTLAGEGWREVVRLQLDELRMQRERVFNNPRTNKVDEVFRSTLGIEHISQAWQLDGYANGPHGALDEFIEIRGAIAHRRQADVELTKNDVKAFFGLVLKLIRATDTQIEKLLISSTGKGWTEKLEVEPGDSTAGAPQEPGS